MAQIVAFQKFSQEDFPALAAFLTRLYPHTPVAAETLRRFNAGRLPEEHHARTLAWNGAELLGMVETERSRQFTRPGWYGLHVHTAEPELRQRLLELGLDTLRPLSPTVLHTALDEASPEQEWLLEQGWQEHERTWLSFLDLSTFRPEVFADRQARSRVAGTEIMSLTDLGWDDSEAMQRRLYNLTVELLSDVPTTDPVRPWPFEVWQQRVINQPEFTPDGLLIAVQRGEWIGLTELYRPLRELPGTLHQGLTGVRRGWRGQGVAWALKLAAARRAKTQGWQTVRTANHTVNREMLGINAAMGFVLGPARVILVQEGSELYARSSHVASPRL